MQRISLSPTFVLFSGYNDRAVVALSRFFVQTNLSWAIVASGANDVIHRTLYRDRVVFSRLNKRVDLDLFAAISNAVGGPLVLCPTTEFMNKFLLDHRDAVVGLRTSVEGRQGAIDAGLPSSKIYARLTGKFTSQVLVEQLVGLKSPPLLPWPPKTAPCVLKPHDNVAGSCVFYPRLCLTGTALQEALQTLDPILGPKQWFAQAYVVGQSYYLCGYLTRQGERSWYWQENLLQQPGGKSILLARSCETPGLDADALFDGLASLGYHGPLMMEVIRDGDGVLHYIEINPRFWGPLQLALNLCPQVLVLFVRDYGAEVPDVPAPAPSPTPHWYSWAQGAAVGNCHRYPAAVGFGPLTENAPILIEHDIYAAEDTRALHRCF